MSQKKLSERLRELSQRGYNSGRFNKIDVDALITFSKEAEALESLSRQPPQAPDIDKIMEVVGGEANGAAERIAQEISEPRKALEQMCSFIRLRLYNELRVAPRQPAQTEDLEASVWIATIVYPNGDESYKYAATREAAAQLGYESTRVSGTVVSVLPAFARSISEPK